MRSIDVSAEIAEQIRDLIARGMLSPGVHLIPTRIAEQIRELTIKGGLAPGVSLTRLKDLEQFSVSRMPVREALKLLVGEGVVTRDQNRGFFVATLSSEEASQLYRLRHLIEAELLSTVVWPNAKELKALRKQIDKIEHDLAAKHYADWLYSVREFHRMIFELSPKKILIRETLRLWTLCDRYRSLLISAFSNPDSMSTATHLIDALSRQDRKQLLNSFEQDLKFIERNLIGILKARGL